MLRLLCYQEMRKALDEKRISGLLDENMCFVLSHVIPDQDTCSRFLREFKSRWLKVDRSRCRFEAKYSGWLNSEMFIKSSTDENNNNNNNNKSTSTAGRPLKDITVHYPLNLLIP